MLFNTVTYAIFFPAVFTVAWLLSPWRKWRLRFLLICSYVFYAGWTFVGWGPLWDAYQAGDTPALIAGILESCKYVPLLFTATSIDFYLGIWLDRIDDPFRRKVMLIATICENVAILIFFKYWNWGADVVIWGAESFFGIQLPDVHLEVELPIGISFFCFMSLSYVIDVYRRHIPACPSYLNYLTYISFFPHLVAGPIIRGRDLLPHLERDTHLSSKTSSEGLFLIMSGLFKKVVIGDYIAVNFVDRVFAAPATYSSVEVMTAMYGYAVQVYCDFAGYSDVAIGSALLLGYRFKINFDAPFKSTNIVEFWRRWHISLSTWLRDYIYIPLGGGRVGPFRKYFNIFLTMLICGVWHGAAWTYFVFGCIQGLQLSITHWFTELRKNPTKALGSVRGITGVIVLCIAMCWPVLHYFGHPGIYLLIKICVVGGAAVAAIVWAVEETIGDVAKIPLRIFCIAANFTFVGLTFTMFRAASLEKAGAMYDRLATLTTYTPNLHRNVVLIILLALALQWVPRRWYDTARDLFIRAPAAAQGAVMILIAYALREAHTADAVPFVYFQF